MNKEITLGSLFDGIAGFPLAAALNEITPVWASEIEPFPIAVSRQSFPHMKHLGNIKNLNGKDLQPVDIIAGGSPCQDLSIAGKRQGLEGARSNLFLEQIRIIKEMRKNEIESGKTEKDVKPRFLVWENVPGVFSSSKGEDFRRVLEEICQISDETVVIPRPTKDKWLTAGCIMGENFSVAWRVLDAQYWGVPQRRRRIFLVADFGGQSAPQILFDPESLHGNTEASGNQQETTSDRFGEGIGTSSSKKLKVMPFDTSFILSSQSHNNPKFGDPCHTLGAKAHVPKIVIENCYCISGQTIDRKPQNGGNGTGVKQEVSFTLKTSDRHAVCCVAAQQAKAFSSSTYSGWRNSNVGGRANHSPIVLENHPTDSRIKVDESDTIQTLTSRMGTGGNNVPLIMDTPTKINDENSSLDYIVRRLTLLECERLQGFPDYWTLLDHKESLNDEEFDFWKRIYILKRKIKREPTQQQVLNYYNKLCSDNARYKALGNSVAIPCVEFVMRRIKEVAYGDAGGKI